MTLKSLIKGHSLITVSSGTTVYDTVKSMSFHNIGLVPIIDGEKLLGVFSERDLLTKVTAEDLDPKVTVIDTVMSSNIVSCESGELYSAALDKMKNMKIRHIVVTEDNKIFGIVSMRDLLEKDLIEKNSTLEMLNNYIKQ